jgi:hypothetical protein
MASTSSASGGATRLTFLVDVMISRDGPKAFPLGVA